MRLLLAEDDPRLLKSLIHIFEANKYAADGVNNGEDALNYARSGEYDGLVLDIMMPGLDGIEVLKRLRSEGVTTPALFLTARTEISQRVEGLDAGADDKKILIPYSTATKMTGEKNVSSFYVKAASDDSVDTAISLVKSFLLQITRDEDAYEVRNQSDVLDAMSDVKNTMSLLLAGIAAISLLVGGIGIMNIMLVSVSERTREIGIRKAVCAKRIHIMTQFLCEACILSVLGGIIGLLLSFGAVVFYRLIASSAVSMNWGVGFAAIAFCAVIGVLFGGYPAAKASRLQPIDALHTT